MVSAGVQYLLRVIEERDVPLGHDDIAWAFEGATQYEVESWIQEYLGPSSLLTKEELTFHEKQSVLRPKDPRVSPSRPLSDTDFEAAIASLEASTAAISKQCQRMEVQKEALLALKARNGCENGAEQAGTQRQKQLAREKAQLEFEFDDLNDSLRYRLKESSTDVAGTITSLPSSVEKFFEKDDRLLDGLHKLLPKFAETGAQGSVEREVERLCKGLVALTAQEVRSRIDATYRTASGQHSSQSNGHSSPTQKQQTSLRAELEELSGEIDSLATMAVDSQYRGPILRELESTQTDSILDKARWGDYVLASLQYLTTRLEALDDHYLELYAHHRALQSITAALDGIQATPAPSKQEAPATPTARGLKPLRLVQANLSEDPTLQLFRYLDIRVADPTDTAKLAATLEHAVRERQAALGDLEVTTAHTISDQLAQTVHKADRDVQDLLGAVYAHSQYGTIRLMESDVQEGLGELEEKTQSLGEQMRSLDLDALGRKSQAY